MDYLVKIRSVQTPLNGQFSIGANSHSNQQQISFQRKWVARSSGRHNCYYERYAVRDANKPLASISLKKIGLGL